MLFSIKAHCAAIFLAIFTLTSTSTFAALGMRLISDDEFYSTAPAELWKWVGIVTQGDGASLGYHDVSLYNLVDDIATYDESEDFGFLTNSQGEEVTTHTLLSVDANGQATLKTTSLYNNESVVVSGSLSGTVQNGQTIYVRTYAAGGTLGHQRALSIAILQEGTYYNSYNYGRAESDDHLEDTHNVLEISDVSYPMEIEITGHTRIGPGSTEALRELSIIAVPEPGSAALMLLGAVSLTTLRRRRV